MNTKTKPNLSITGSGTQRLLWLSLIIFLNISCSNKRSDDRGLSTAGITICGTVQFSEGYGKEIDSLISYGLALVHHMTYDEAEKVFDNVIETSPTCFWGHWGKALTYIHPVWPDEPGEERMKLGNELTQKALQLASKPRETAFGEALATYYTDGLGKNERQRLMELEAGWEKAFAQYPDDLEIKSWYALTLISTADPTDKTYKNQIKAGQLAEEVLAVIPDHPGGFHYAIHAYDYPELAEKAIAAANKYSDIAPDVPHALHMPSHIFTRLGLWKESIDWNMRSAMAASTKPAGSSVSMHYFHAVDYIVYAHLQQLEDDQVKKIIDDVKNVEGPYQEHAATAYTVAAVDGRYALERQDWKKAAAVEARPANVNWDKFPEFEALEYFVIGLGSARSGQTAKAESAVKRLDELKQKVANPYWAQQVEIQKNTVKAWLEFSKGKESAALELMTLAASQENATNKHPITPGELLPASELLGDMLLELKKPQEALVQYEIALDRSPRRFNSLYGAASAAELLGDAAKAKTYYQTLIEVSANAEVSLSRREKALKYINGV
jgi:tetratricopeptide (TPR) repeat protein